MTIINTRADLDALKGTAQHAAFMNALAGSIWHLQKDDEAKCWTHVKNTNRISQFEFTEADFPGAKPPELPHYTPPPGPNPKMTGIEFEGVMCSATRDDQSGLLAVLAAYQLSATNFKPTQFEFSNGSKLVLTKQNLQQFIAVWMPFRQSFFTPPTV